VSSQLIVIPALDEEATVGAVVTSIRAQLDADILVVDDGSTDRTVAEAVAAGAKVLSHPYNLGVGAALRSGFRYAVANGYDAVVQVDADGQHDVEAASRLLARLEADGLDLVVGSRFGSDYEVGVVRRTSMRMLSRSVSRRLGVEINDTTSGFRAFGPQALARFARAYPSAYLSDTVEALLLAGDWGLKVAEEPVQMRPRAGGKPSSGALKSAFHLLRLGMVILLHKVRRPREERVV
jgi:glycosyltransferase involved in cell wall biosynthesis